MNKSTAAMRLRTIRDQNVIAHKGHQDRLALAESVMRADARRNQELEYNKLLGASAFGGLSAYSLARLEDLKKVKSMATTMVNHLEALERAELAALADDAWEEQHEDQCDARS